MPALIAAAIDQLACSDGVLESTTASCSMEALVERTAYLDGCGRWADHPQEEVRIP